MLLFDPHICEVGGELARLGENDLVLQVLKLGSRAVIAILSETSRK